MVFKSENIFFIKLAGRKRIFTDAGFTLVELIIAMAVAAIVALAGFGLFNATNKSYLIEEGVSEAQQYARASMNKVSQDLRLSGFGLPKPPFSIQIGSSPVLKSPLTVVDNYNGAGPDSITVLGIGYEAGKLTGANTQGQAFLCYSSFYPGDDKILYTSGSARRVRDSRSHISVDGVLYLTLDPDTDSISCGTGAKSLPLKAPAVLKNTLGSGKIYIIQAVQYSIVTDTPTSQPPCTEERPCLKSLDYSTLRGANNQTVAERVEDLQFAYGIDANGDGVLDDMDGNGVFSEGDYVDSHSVGSEIMAVRATIVSRSANKDSQGRTFNRPAIENHAAGAADSYRRRILTRVIKIRN